MAIVQLQVSPQIADQSVSFDDFWLLYPRHVAKLDARKAWARIDASQHVEILVALEAWRRVWAGKDLDFIPYPATWLRGERWTDDLPPGYAWKAPARPEIASPGNDNHIQARTPMPQHVIDAIARLKARL